MEEEDEIQRRTDYSSRRNPCYPPLENGRFHDQSNPWQALLQHESCKLLEANLFQDKL